MRNLCYKLCLLFLSLFITNQTFARTAYTYETLYKHICTHPEEVKEDVLLFCRQAVAEKTNYRRVTPVCCLNGPATHEELCSFCTIRTKRYSYSQDRTLLVTSRLFGLHPTNKETS